MARVADPDDGEDDVRSRSTESEYHLLAFRLIQVPQSQIQRVDELLSVWARIQFRQAESCSKILLGLREMIVTPNLRCDGADFKKRDDQISLPV